MAEKEPRDVVLTLRIPKRIADRIGDLRPFIEEQPVFAMKSRLNRSDVIRYLLLEGIRKVEREAEAEPVE
jgi:hypothetical protein